jgi:hypothetical protein
MGRTQGVESDDAEENGFTGSARVDYKRNPLRIATGFFYNNRESRGGDSREKKKEVEGLYCAEFRDNVC